MTLYRICEERGCVHEHDEAHRLVPVDGELVVAMRDGKTYLAVLDERAYTADEVAEMLAVSDE